VSDSSGISTAVSNLALCGEDAVGLHLLDLLRAELGVEDTGLRCAGVPFVASPSGSELRIELGPTDIRLDRLSVLDSIRAGGSAVSEFLRRALPMCKSIEIVMSEAVQSGSQLIRAGHPRLSVDRRDIIHVDAIEAVKNKLADQRLCVLIGSSSSGKTVVGDGVLRARLESGVPALWIDMSAPGATLAGVFGAIMQMPAWQGPGQPLVVVDDIQSAPELARDVLALFDVLNPDVDLLLIAWPDAKALISEQFDDACFITLRGSAVCRHLATRLSAGQEVIDTVLELASGDTLVANLACKFVDSNRRAPTMDEIAKSAFESIISGQELEDLNFETLGMLSALSVFEVDASPALLPLGKERYCAELVTRGIVRQKGDYVVVGHRVLAGLVLRHLTRNRLLPEEFNPIAFSVDYLRGAGSSQIKQTLDRLDLVAVAGSDTDQFGAAFLADCWNSLRVLVDLLKRQQVGDPTWGDNVASATFAAEAFGALGMRDEWSKTAEYIRSRWLYSSPTSDGHLPMHSPGETAEFDDFREIVRAMREEDEILPPNEDDAADQIDVDRFHRNWVLGLLLGFESRALDGRRDLVNALIAMAMASQEDSGAFYPRRVPWVTARVLLGAASCAHRDADEVVVRAAGWLRSPRPHGPRSLGVWKPRTGRWNTDLQMTAMALLALGRAGFSASDPAIKSGLSYLRDGRGEWYRAGKEIDCAQAVEAALVLGGSWREYDSELRSLLEWARDARAWIHAGSLASVVQDESSKAPAVAASLISIIWETVRAELPLLFEGVSGLSNLASAAVDGGETSSKETGEAKWVSQRTLLARVDALLEHTKRSIIERKQISNPTSPTLQALAQWEKRRDSFGDLRDRIAALDVNAKIPQTLIDEVNLADQECFGSNS
jgi:hypothetical protein